MWVSATPPADSPGDPAVDDLGAVAECPLGHPRGERQPAALPVEPVLGGAEAGGRVGGAVMRRRSQGRGRRLIRKASRAHRIARRRSISPDVVEIRLRRRGTVGGATKRILPVAPLAEHLVVEPVPLGGSGARHEVAGRGCKDPWRVSETVARGAGQTGGVEGLECRLRGGGYYTDSTHSIRGPPLTRWKTSTKSSARSGI